MNLARRKAVAAVIAINLIGGFISRCRALLQFRKLLQGSVTISTGLQGLQQHLVDSPLLVASPNIISNAEQLREPDILDISFEFWAVGDTVEANFPNEFPRPAIDFDNVSALVNGWCKDAFPE